MKDSFYWLNYLGDTSDSDLALLILLQKQGDKIRVYKPYIYICNYEWGLPSENIRYIRGVLILLSFLNPTKFR